MCKNRYHRLILFKKPLFNIINLKLAINITTTTINHKYFQKPPLMAALFDNVRKTTQKVTTDTRQHFCRSTDKVWKKLKYVTETCQTDRCSTWIKSHYEYLYSQRCELDKKFDQSKQTENLFQFFEFTKNSIKSTTKLAVCQFPEFAIVRQNTFFVNVPYVV